MNAGFSEQGSDANSLTLVRRASGICVDLAAANILISQVPHN